MPTLKEAVESGRRWRWTGYAGEGSADRSWQGPWVGKAGGLMFSVETMFADTFELEPEPEKPREWFLCSHESPYGSTAHVTRDDLRSTAVCSCGEAPSGIHRRVHDADACDRLRAKP